MNQLLVNLDVPDLDSAVRFYGEAFGVRVGRRLGGGFVELVGLPSPLYLLETREGSAPFDGAAQPRGFQRHWTPVHLDIAVDDIEAAVVRAVGAGAKLETPISTKPYGKLAVLSDPFGHGFCFIEFNAEGYDAIADP